MSDHDLPVWRYEVHYDSAQSRTAEQQKMATLLQDCLYQQMQSQSDMCDVTLVIGGVETKAHWCVLAICPYFESVYKSEMKERLAGKITLDFGNPAAIRSAIRFLYTGSVDMNDSNIKELLQASDYLQIERLKEMCKRFLNVGLVNIKNCVGLCVLANMYDLDYLYNKAVGFMNGHLPQVLEEEEALTLTSDCIQDMILNEKLRYVSVEKFFKFLLKWVNCDKKHRETYFCKLFSQLNLSRVTEQFLKCEIETNDIVKNSDSCQGHVNEHKEKITKGEKSHEVPEKQVILVTGSLKRDFFLGVGESVLAYIISEKRWVQLPPLPRSVSQPLIASDGKQAFYVINSNNRYDHRQFIHKFVPSSKEWFTMSVTLPESLTEPSVEYLACASGKVFMVVSVLILDVHAGRRWSCHLLQLNETKREMEEKCTLFNRGMNSQFKGCTAMGRYVCVCGWKVTGKAVRSTGGNKFAKFVYYDAEKEAFYDRSKGAFFQNVMFSLRNEIVLARPGKIYARSFNLISRKWRQRNEYSLPAIAEEPDRSDYCYCEYDGRVYVFCGKSAATKLPLSSAVRFDVQKKKCEILESLPFPMTNSACCAMTLPTDLLRCSIDCPHCENLGPRELAEYHEDDLHYSDDDDMDDDYLHSDTDYDDEDYDDHWAGVFFNSSDDEFGAAYYMY